MKKVRYVHAEKDEHIVVTRNKDSLGSGCAGLLLLTIFFSLGDFFAVAIQLILGLLVAVAAFGLALWRLSVDIRFRARDRLIISICFGAIVALLGTYLLHDRFVDWATHTSYETTGHFKWKTTYITKELDSFKSKFYHTVGFLAIWANVYMITSMIHHLIEDHKR